MTVYLVYYDTARVGRRWLGRAGGQWTWGDRDHATRFPARHHAETALRVARRHAAGIEQTHDQKRGTHDVHA